MLFDVLVDEIDPITESDPIDPVRTLYLGFCTTMLFVAFVLLLIGDQVSAMSF